MFRRIVVTGAKGLIGSEVCRLLSDLGHEVVQVDRAFDRSHPGCVDTRDHASITKLVQNCSGIIHLAAISRVVWGEQDPEQCWDVNVQATRNIVEQALLSPHRPWILFASSREVYGQQDKLPVSEDAPLLPMNVYAKSKVAGEEIIQEGARRGLSTSIVRFSNVFGSPHDHVDRVIPAFCRAALQDERLRIDGASHTFDFTFYKDVAKGVMEIVRCLELHAQGMPVIHFTSGRGLTLAEAASIVCRLSNSKSHIVEGTPRSFDVSSFIGNPARARQILKWVPETSFEEGVLALLTSLSQEVFV